MIPVPFQGQTRELGAPASWDEEVDGPCMVLPIKETTYGGRRMNISTWLLTGDELEALVKQHQAGEQAYVRFGVQCDPDYHPVIAAWVE